MKLESLLKEEIDRGFSDLKDLEIGSDEYKSAVEAMTKLMDKAIDMDNFESELQNKIDARSEEKQDRIVKNILTVLGIAVPTGVTIWGTFKTFEFEQTGTVTTIMGRGFIQKLLPGKK